MGVTRIRRSGLVSSGVLLFLALNVANVSNYLYQVIMGRSLHAHGNYSLLNSVVQLVNVVAPSLTFLQTASAKAIASATEAPVPLAQPWHDPLTRAALKWCGVATLIFILASPLIAGAIHTSSVGPALILAAGVIPAAMLAIGQGRLQGLHALRAFAILAISVAVLRLILGPLAVALGTGVTGAGMALALAAFLGSTWALYRTRRAGPVSVAAVRGDLGRGAFALVFFWLMVSADIVAARVFLTINHGQTANQYTAASVVGKAVFWLPAAVTIAVYPRVARDRSRGTSTTALLVRSMILTLGLSSFAVLALKVLGPTVIPIFYGHGYDQASRLSWEVGLAVIPFALGNLLVYYHLASEGVRVAVAVAVAAGAEFVALALNHGSVHQIAISLGIGGVVLCAGLLAVEFLWPERRPSTSDSTLAPAPIEPA